MRLRAEMGVPLVRRMTFSQQFLLFGLIVLLAGMLTIGLWVQSEIRRVFTARTAAVTALYVDSFMAHHVQALDEGVDLDAASVAQLDDHLGATSLGQDFVTVKVWRRDGTIAYSTADGLVGRTFELDDDLERAFQGEVVSRITDLSEPSNEVERLIADSLIETYAPISLLGTDETVAVAEFYQRPDALVADIGRTQRRGWLIIMGATAGMYLMLVGLARRASKLIESQRTELEGNVSRLSNLLNQNEQLQERMRGAAGRVTALNEAYLHRISADLHDGPAQNVALALLRMEDQGNGDRPQPGEPEMETIRSALETALTDLRSIAAGLRLPEVETLSPVDAALQVVHDFERVAGAKVDVRWTDMPETAPLSVKITMFRVLQEGLANSYKHAGNASRRVAMTTANGHIVLDIADDGPGFDPGVGLRDDALGLQGMRERVEMLGGSFDVTSALGEGTRLRALLPLQRAGRG